MTKRFDYSMTKDEVSEAYSHTMAAAKRVLTMNFGSHEDPESIEAQLTQMRDDLEQALMHIGVGISLVKQAKPVPVLQPAHGKAKLRVVK